MAKISKGWRGLALELLVVFLGVLIALGVDSSWQSHQDRVRVVAYLQSIDADMADVTRRVGSVLADVQRTRDENEARLRLLSSSEPPPDSVGGFGGWWPGPLRLPLGTLQAFVETGDVNLLPDPRLRARIVSALSRFQEAEAALARNSDMAYENWARRETLAAEVSMRNGHGWPPVVSIPEARREPGLIAWRGIHGAILRQIIMELEEIQATSGDLRAALQGS